MLDVISILRQISGIVASTVIKFGKQLPVKFIDELVIKADATVM